MNTPMQSPIDAFASWYQSLHFHDQLHLALLVASAEGIDAVAPELVASAEGIDPVLPEGTSPEDNPTLPQGFIARLKRPYRRRLEVLGRIAIVRTIMEVLLAMPNADNATWAMKRAQLTTFAAMESSRGDTKTAGLFKHLRDRILEEEDRWADIWFTWTELTEKQGALSDESLRRWFEEGSTGELSED